MYLVYHKVTFSIAESVTSCTVHILLVLFSHVSEDQVKLDRIAQKISQLSPSCRPTISVEALRRWHLSL